MNKLIKLNAEFQPVKKKGGPTEPSKEFQIIVDDLVSIREDIVYVCQYWSKQKNGIKPLVNVRCNKTIPKTSRCVRLFNDKQIVGVKYVGEGNDQSLFTYCIELSLLEKNIEYLDKLIEFISKYFDGCMNYAFYQQIYNNEFNSEIEALGLKKSHMLELIRDTIYISKVFVQETLDITIEKTNMINLFNTGDDVIEQLQRIGVNLDKKRILEHCVRLTDEELIKIKENAPYLISMGVSDLYDVDFENSNIITPNKLTIPDPNNEPVVGVIDSLFDEEVYFSKWVKYEKWISEDLGEDLVSDKQHGTSVSSIIVDGPSFNKKLEDNCGRFQVKHFGVIKKGVQSSFTIMKQIELIVSQNPQIKVWNLSLGSSREISENFISPEAYILDKIQYKYNVIFIISGTNSEKDSVEKKIGSPADSINAIVVNSVKLSSKQPASYNRYGFVLRDYIKPDISYYGGDYNEAITVCSPLGESKVHGTSYAAPWITRKVAYLVHRIGLPIQAAKALIIDSAITWEKLNNPSKSIGYGVVPINIHDILQSRNEEIKFIITKEIKNDNIKQVKLPVPIDNNHKHNFITKYTMAYMTDCSITHGVEYANTQINVSFGRLKDDQSTIVDISKTGQDKEIATEKELREDYKKWVNVKSVMQSPNKSRKLKPLNSKYPVFGFYFSRIERINTDHPDNIRFSMVVTMKDLDNKNNCETFLNSCILERWSVSLIDIEQINRIESKLNEDIDFKND